MRGNIGYLIVGFFVGSIISLFNLIACIVVGSMDVYPFLVAGIIALCGICLYGVSWIFGDANCTKSESEEKN